MRGADVVISYRRQDASAAGRVADWLAAHFGADRVFLDESGIAGGQQFPIVIEEAIRDCRAVVAVITPRWGDRLALPGDWVFRELSLALTVGKPIVPALLDGASPPARADLPAELAPLADTHALTLSAANFRGDVARLIEALEGLTVERETRRAFAEVAPYGRVEARAAWDAADDPQNARRRLTEALGAHGMHVAGDSSADLSVTGGNKLKARLLGGLTGPPARLPSRGLLRIRDRGATVGIELLLAEDWGAGVLGGIGGRYESFFQRVIADLQRATTRS